MIARALAILLALALLLAVWLRMDVVEARADLNTEQAARARENASRFSVVLTDTQRVAGAQGQHAADQQGITHGLNQEKRGAAVAAAGRRAVVDRVRITAARLDAASGEREAKADTASCRDQADRHQALGELLRASGRLLVRAAELSAEAGELLGQREAEVRALMKQIDADRALMDRASGPNPP